jgi:hypothetical protein
MSADVCRKKHTHVNSFCANKTTLIWQLDAPCNPLVCPAVYEFSDSDWLDLEVIREITNAQRDQDSSTGARGRGVHHGILRTVPLRKTDDPLIE